LNIIKAVKAFNKGKRIYRASWPHLETLGFETSARFVGGFPTGAYMSNASGCTELYNFTLGDIYAEDWQVADGARLI